MSAHPGSSLEFSRRHTLPEKQRAVQFNLAIQVFFNQGGTPDEAIALVRAAHQSGSVDLGSGADQAKKFVPSASRPHDAVLDLRIRADKAASSVPGAASTESGGKGLSGIADQAKDLVPPAAAPDRHGAGLDVGAGKACHDLPRPVSSTYLDAARSASRNVARTVLDSFRIRDGRAIGNVFMIDLPGLRAENNREAILLGMIQRHVANPPLGARVRDVLQADDLERMIQKAAELSDVA